MTADMLSRWMPDLEMAPSIATAIPSVTSAVVGVLKELLMPRCSSSASPGSADHGDPLAIHRSSRDIICGRTQNNTISVRAT